MSSLHDKDAEMRTGDELYQTIPTGDTQRRWSSRGQHITNVPIRLRRPTTVVLESYDRLSGSVGQRSPSSATHKDEVSRSSFRDCPNALRLAVHRCSKRHYGALMCSISCVHSSRQRLSTDGLRGALTLYVEDLDDLPEVASAKAFQQWLGRFDSLFKIEMPGALKFTLSEMPRFLSAYPISGLDASHRTIAMLCLAQLDIEQRRPRQTYSREPNGDTEFSVYARDNWRFHESIAERTSLSLSLDGSRRNRATKSRRAAKFATLCATELGSEEMSQLDGQSWEVVGVSDSEDDSAAF